MDLSAQEICDIKTKSNDLGIMINLPSSKVGVKMRAEKENWISRQVPGKGGRGGLKTVYTLPSYVIEELREKGLLHLIEEGKEEHHSPEINRAAAAIAPVPLPESMDSLIADYPSWAEKQDVSAIVPIRYYVNVFGSAGAGSIAWDAEQAEAMWFRASFFKHLNVLPGRCFCTRIKGDSMFPTLIDLGTALWHATSRYTEEGIYLFRQYDEIRIKRLQRLNAHTFNIISDNPNKGIYPTTELDLTQIEPYDFEILGRYLWSCGISR